MFRKTIMALSLVGLVFIGTVDAQADPIRDQLIENAWRPINRYLAMCEYSAQFDYLIPKKQLPELCALVRAGAPRIIADMKKIKDINVLSSSIDQFEIDMAPALQKMEAIYKQVQRLSGFTPMIREVPQLTEQERLGKFVTITGNIEIMRK